MSVLMYVCVTRKALGHANEVGFLTVIILHIFREACTKGLLMVNDFSVTIIRQLGNSYLNLSYSHLSLK